MRSRISTISRTWISMSVDWPWAPPCGWWMRTRAFGSVYRSPGAPAASSTAAAEAACPTHIVDTGDRRNCIVSWMANRAVMSPPGLLMYRWIGRSGSSPSRKSSCATTRLATLSSSAVPRNTMRSRSSRDQMS